MTINTNKIHQHLKELQEALTFLLSKKEVALEEVLKDYELRLAIERAFHLCIQNSIDIGSHILAGLNINNIETYADVPRKLAKQKIISKKLAENMVQMAKLRNILVHDYIKLETKKLVSYLANLGDFESFVRSINRFLGK